MEIKKEEFEAMKKKHSWWTTKEVLINLVVQKKISTDRMYLSRCCWVECRLQEPWFYSKRTNKFHCPKCKKEVTPIHILEDFKEVWINHGESMDLES